MSIDENPEHEPDVAVPTARDRANRANAVASTGPKTAEGKAISSTNAITHGAYARPSAVTVGCFAEDPEELAEFHAAVVRDLEPSSVLQAAIAGQIADTLIQARRLQAFEANRLRVAGTDPWLSSSGAALETLTVTSEIGRRLARRLGQHLGQLAEVKALATSAQDPLAGGGSGESAM